MARMKKTGALALVICLAVLMLSGCSGSREFTSNGISITLPSYFKVSEAEGQTACFKSNNVIVLALREGFELMDSFADMELWDYALMVLDANGFDCDLNEEGNMVWFEYERTEGEQGAGYHYLACCYKAEGAFWLVQFSSTASYYPIYRENMFEWARTVAFSDRI